MTDFTVTLEEQLAVKANPPQPQKQGARIYVWPKPVEPKKEDKPDEEEHRE
jgi:hypothetical protein